MSQIARHRVVNRVGAVTAATLALVLPLVGLGAAEAAVPAPSGLASMTAGSSTPILSWRGVSQATYRVQADDDPGFGSPEFTETTANINYVPDTHLPSGTVYWRVQALRGSESSSWSRSQVTVSPADIPAPVGPPPGTTINPGKQAPLLTWQTSRGATSYTVQLDGDEDFVGAQTFTTQSTSFVIPVALSAGDWFWRVIANKGKSIVSQPSPAMSFEVLPLSAPKLTSPDDTFEEVVEDVVLDWTEVDGAATYDLEIATDKDFANFAFTASGLTGTRYSPPTTPFNDEFWWRVRAVDAAGVSTPWTESRFNFKRQWLDQPQAVHPRGTSAAPGLQDSATTYFEWTPAQHASHYQVEISTNLSFSPAISCRQSSNTTLTTAATTFIPRFTGKANDCLIPETLDTTQKNVWYWRVRPLDTPYLDPDGLPGVWSPAQAFYRTPLVTDTSGPTPTVEEMASNWARGLKVSITGTGARDGNLGCESTPSIGFPDATSYTRPSICEAMSATPVLSWDPVPHATSYIVWFGQDENFTTTEVQPFATANTMAAIDFRKEDFKDPIALPESEAKAPYYWHVQACGSVGCSYRPDGQLPGISGSAAFGKTSPPVTGLRSASGSTDDIWFEWEDYLTTNQRTSSFGEPGVQTARQYEIQVATEPGFSTVIDTAKVDQATYTAGKKLYPQGTLHWRVRAIDAQKNALAWSEPAQVLKRTPSIPLTSPADGTAVAGTTPFEWEGQSFASKYEIEVNGDAAFSPGTRVFTATTTANAYAPLKPIPASSGSYWWRVRKIDNSRNPGPWSDPRSFKSTGTAPVLVSPARGRLVSATNGLFTWTDVAGAASYLFRASSGSRYVTQQTAATAFAPTRAMTDGNWTWTVTARDSAGNALGTSEGWNFWVDGTSPKITSVKPLSSAKPKSNLVATFSERVRGVSGKTMKLYVKGSKKPLKARVQLNSTGTKVVLNPSKNLRRGKTYTVKWVHSNIKDVAGNALVKPRQWTITVR